MGKKPAEKESKAKTPKEKIKRAKVAAKKKTVTAKPEAPSNQTCRVGGCKREYRAKGYCRVHYKKWRRGEFGDTRYKCCHEMNCFKPMSLNRHGLCEEHHQSFYIQGAERAKVAPPAPPAKKEEKQAGAA